MGKLKTLERSQSFSSISQTAALEKIKPLRVLIWTSEGFRVQFGINKHK